MKQMIITNTNNLTTDISNNIRSDWKAILIKGECLEVMKKLIDMNITVDMVLTDPPYGTINGMEIDGWKGTDNTKWDTVLDTTDMFGMCNQIIRMNGAVCLFSQEPYSSFLRTNAHSNLPFSYDYIWLKDHFANCLISKKAPVRYTEDISVFFKKYDDKMVHPLRKYAQTIKDFINKPKSDIFSDMGNQSVCHFFRVDSLQFSICTQKCYNQLIELYHINNQKWFIDYEQMIYLHNKYNKCFNLPKNINCKSNVLQYKKDYGVRFHPTQKPVALLEDLIKTYTNDGDTVLDFTMGSGSTAIACINTNRKFIGIELDEKYFNIAKTRVDKHFNEMQLKLF